MKSSILRQRVYYILSDFLGCNAALAVFNIIRYYTLPLNAFTPSLTDYYHYPMVVIGQIFFPIMMVILYSLSGFYNEVYFKSRASNVVNTLGISLIGTIIVFFVALYNDSIDDRLRNYEMVAVLYLLFSVFTLIPRWIITNITIARVKNKAIFFNTLIVGVSEKAKDLANELNTRYPTMGFNVVGFVSEHSDKIKELYLDNERYPVYNINELKNIQETVAPDSFIIAAEDRDTKETIKTINTLLPLGRSVYLTPDILHLITLRPHTQMVSGKVLIDVSKSRTPASTLNIKRVSDVAISAIALVLLSPLLAMIAFAVKRSSPGPVIYKQERIGYNKKPFNIYKYRTMYTDSEVNGPSLSSADDPRITPIGRFLRKYRLDELPQFWNVVKGDMSIVGPRPEREYFLKQIIDKAPYYCLLQQVRPGITSWGMVKYGYASNVEQMIERAQYDLLYIDNVSFVVDLKILLYTIETVITGRGV